MTAPSTLWSELQGLDYSIKHVQVGDWSTRVARTGRGEPLVLMHGTGGHLEAFVRNFRALGEHYEVIAFDSPGHGWTTVADHDLEIPEYQDHLLALMDALGIESAHVSGESLGGWIAVKFAAANPERVRSLILNTPASTLWAGGLGTLVTHK